MNGFFYLTELFALTMNQSSFSEDYIIDIADILLHQFGKPFVDSRSLNDRHSTMVFHHIRCVRVSETFHYGYDREILFLSF